MGSTYTAEVRDVDGREDDTPWRFISPATVQAGGSSGSIITSSPKRTVYPADGSLTVDLEPGPAVVEFRGEAWRVTVLAGGNLWDLIAAGTPVGTVVIDGGTP